jgi:hypothetical protein
MVGGSLRVLDTKVPELSKSGKVEKKKINLLSAK